jgi:hypothetical protein
MKRVILWLMLVLVSPPLLAFDHRHTQWNRLLQRHVVVIEDGRATRLRYAALATEHPALRAYLDQLSAVTVKDYAAWTRAQQLAFLINAYNAFTVEKVLSRYPNLSSIRDFGRFFGNPWRDRFFTLLGADRNLDEVEKGLILAPGVFDEPRVHFALNCASVGCPALRPEAYDARTLDRQLAQQTRLFLSDRSRNGFNPQTGELEVSKIFDWYDDDFIQAAPGQGSVAGYLAGYADQLADQSRLRALIRAAKVPLGFRDYDWSLNDGSRSGID